MSEAVLTMNQVQKRYRSGSAAVEALRGVTLSISSGETVALVGPSGSGKSTMLALAAGLDLPTSGSVLLEGVDLGSLDEDGRALLRNRSIGFVYQSFHLLPTLTALENVMLPLELLASDSFSAIRASARQLLEEVGLAARIDHYPAQLSGGEQQRVALARAFVTGPKLLLADEPTGNLDRANAEIALELMHRLTSELSTAILLVTHDLEVAARMGRRLTIRDGTLVP